MLGADRSLVHAGDQRGTTRCADAGGGKDIGKTNSLTGQSVEGGRDRYRIAKGANPRAHVFGYQQQDIGSGGLARCDSSREHQCNQGESSDYLSIPVVVCAHCNPVASVIVR